MNSYKLRSKIILFPSINNINNINPPLRTFTKVAPTSIAQSTINFTLAGKTNLLYNLALELQLNMEIREEG